MATETFKSVQMPSFVDAAKIPNGIWNLGGENLPQICGNADENAPVISAITDLTYPNETLGITGDNLTGASLLIWSEGEIAQVKPLRSDNSKMQAVVPANMPKSMMIVWPKNQNGIGNPVKVNAPIVWWTNCKQLFSNVAEQEIRFFGKSLCIEGKAPIVVMELPDGSCKQLEVVDANPYQIKAKVNAELENGTYCNFYVHNATGGNYGWSNPFVAEVIENKVLSQEELPVISVDDFGAVADDALDDIIAIEKAIAAAAELGGAVIKFGAGEYNISRSIRIPDSFPKGLYFKGVGMGEYDFGCSLKSTEYEHRGLSGKYTSIRFLDPENVPENVLRILGENVYISDMTLFGTDGHSEGYTMANGCTVAIKANNVTLKKLRIIKVDLRDFTTTEEARLMCSNNVDVAVSCKNISILDCEFHTKASAIWMNHYEYEGNLQHVLFRDKRRVENVRIENCDFYGYTSPYTHPSGRRPMADEGEVSRGITATNCDGVVVENCRFQGFDQGNACVLTRCMYLPITDKHLYIANNTARNVGSVPSTGYDGNTGEQILFHGCMDLGGVYDVIKSEGLCLTVRTDNIRLTDENGRYIRPDTTITNAGSRIKDGLKEGTRGMAYICAGKGAGQLRQINSYEIKEKKNIFIIDKPWTVEPDETSIVVETAPFRENIVYKNVIMKDKPTMAQGVKSGGVLMFFDAFNNVIAENEFKNLAFGVSLNTAFKAPLSWNTIRDNKFIGIQEAYKDAAQGGDSTRNATCLCESVVSNAGETNGWDTYNVWYTVGDVFRNNECIDCDTALEIATNRWHCIRNKGIGDYFGEEKGNALTIIENNSFKDVADGILVGNPAYWSLIRNNTYSFKHKDGYNGEKVIYEHDITNFKIVNIEDDKVIDDVNNTLNK